MQQYNPPVLNLADLCSEPFAPEAWALAASQFDDAMRAHGVVYIENCGIPSELVSTLREKAYSYFLEGDMQKSYAKRFGQEGYTATGGETVVKGSGLPDKLESLMLYSADSPACPDEMRDTVREYLRHVNRLLSLFVRLMADGLNAPEIVPTFDGSVSTVFCSLKLSHYPASIEGSRGYGAHKDVAAFTFLAQEDGESFPEQGALEVLVDGNWVAVPPKKDTLVVISGRLIEWWSNGLYKSPIHRVLLKKRRTKSRLSILYFTGPNRNVRIAPLEQCFSNECPPKFEPVTFGEWVRLKL